MSDTLSGRRSCGVFEVNPSREYVYDISRVWESIYGDNDSNRHERIKRLKEQLDKFWQRILEEEETKKNDLVNEIEKKAHEAFNLERALGLPQKVDELGNTNPLIHLQQQVEQLLEEYHKIKEKRLEEFSNLQAEEKQLCLILNENLMIEILESGSSEKFLRLDYMQKCNDRINQLKQQKDTLYQDFESYGEKLKVLMEDLGIQPFRVFERYACGTGYDDYPVTIQNMIKMKDRVEEYTGRKETMIAKADNLRSEIKRMWKKLQKDQFELDELILKHSDFKEATLKMLESVMEKLKKERKLKIKELILDHRKILVGLWEKCCSDESRAALPAYRVDHYTEDILDLHEMEVERLENYYDSYRKIFELTQQHRGLWDRLLHLEELASDKNRLFNNRGGQLLKEEKERKTIQKV